MTANEEPPDLITSLTDDVVLDCLALVPCSDHHTLSLVSCQNIFSIKKKIFKGYQSPFLCFSFLLWILISLHCSVLSLPDKTFGFHIMKPAIWKSFDTAFWIWNYFQRRPLIYSFLEIIWLSHAWCVTTNQMSWKPCVVLGLYILDTESISTWVCYLL
jgi:hypothetical protein